MPSLASLSTIQIHPFSRASATSAGSAGRPSSGGGTIRCEGFDANWRAGWVETTGAFAIGFAARGLPGGVDEQAASNNSDTTTAPDRARIGALVRELVAMKDLIGGSAWLIDSSVMGVDR